MKAQELRIGNWVMTDTGSNYQIELSDFSDWYNDHNSHEYGKYVLPIPLTEEWLLKFGFKKETAWFRNGKHAVNPTIANLYEYRNIPIKEIEYVHQLQNLYYALTGEEL